MTLERYSDSAGCYVLLDSENPAVYKQLFRAAKAKLKLRIKVTASLDSELRSKPTASSVSVSSPAPAVEAPSTESVASPIPEESSLKEASSRDNYLNTVLCSPTAEPTTTSTPAAQSTEPLDPVSITSRKVTFPLRFPLGTGPITEFCIDCNNCGSSIPGEHYHCSICDDGDYDLCPTCVNAGVTCPGDEHWLLKRLVHNGVIMNSTTETLSVKESRPENETTESSTETTAEQPAVQVEPEVKEKLEPVKEEEPATPQVESEDERTCNACFRGTLFCPPPQKPRA